MIFNKNFFVTLCCVLGNLDVANSSGLNSLSADIHHANRKKSDATKSLEKQNVMSSENLILDLEKICLGGQKSDFLNLKLKEETQKKFFETEYIHKKFTKEERKKKIKCLKEVIISNEPTDKIIDLTLIVPGEINGYQFGLEYRAFQNLNSRNIRLHLRFEERNGKKVLISDGSDMFSNSSAIYSFDFSGIDTSRMHRMCAMFAGCTNITSLDLSHFDMDELFYNYGNFKGAFYNCPKLKNLDISSFRKGQKTDDMMVIMFQNPDKNISLDELKRRIDIWQCSRFLGDQGAHYIDVNR